MIREGQGASLYVCPICGARSYRRGRFVEVPESDRTYKGEEIRLPEYCMAIPGTPEDPPMYLGLCRGIMVWTPESSAHDLLPNAFGTVEIDGQSIQFSSLSEIRSFERESEQRSRNGEGAPHVFRQLSQDRSNHDRNSLRGTSLEKNRAQLPVPRTLRGQPITGRAYTPRDDE